MTLTFEQAVGEAPELCKKLEQGEDAGEELGAFLKSSAGARGFFVHWLTGDDYLKADKAEPPLALVSALDGCEEEVSDVMVMNVVMSAATAIAHRRAGNMEQAQNSERTSLRARLLLQAMMPRVPAIHVALTALAAALSEEEDKPNGVDASAEDAWLAFLQRWRYDEEQLVAISEVLDTCRANPAT